MDNILLFELVLQVLNFLLLVAELPPQLLLRLLQPSPLLLVLVSGFVFEIFDLLVLQFDA